MTKTFGNKTSGLSLVEILIAFAIISIAFTALTMSQLTGFSVTRDSAQASLARDISSQHMQLIRGFGFTTFAKCDGSTKASEDAGAPACAGKTNLPNHAGYSLSWRVTNNPTRADGVAFNPNATKPSLLGVEVKVAWNDGDYILNSFLSCADVGESSSTSLTDICPVESLHRKLTGTP